MIRVVAAVTVAAAVLSGQPGLAEGEMTDEDLSFLIWPIGHNVLACSLPENIAFLHVIRNADGQFRGGIYGDGAIVTLMGNELSIVGEGYVFQTDGRGFSAIIEGEPLRGLCRNITGEVAQIAGMMAAE